jgi:hypothetical protein
MSLTLHRSLYLSKIKDVERWHRLSPSEHSKGSENKSKDHCKMRSVLSENVDGQAGKSEKGNFVLRNLWFLQDKANLTLQAR